MLAYIFGLSGYILWEKKHLSTKNISEEINDISVCSNLHLVQKQKCIQASRKMHFGNVKANSKQFLL